MCWIDSVLVVDNSRSVLRIMESYWHICKRHTRPNAWRCNNKVERMPVGLVLVDWLKIFCVLRWKEWAEIGRSDSLKFFYKNCRLHSMIKESCMARTKKAGKLCMLFSVQIHKYFELKIVIISLSVNLNECSGCSKEPSY